LEQEIRVITNLICKYLIELGEKFIATIEHFGSTAIEGLAAKVTIYIMLEGLILLNLLTKLLS
jgi:GrpB-like predicted nucleotidyltransferase (UPF0157 family)